jgi:hypothetical protein
VKNLPESLPENPADSPCRFYLDPDALEDRGYLGELSHALEVSFVMHLQPLQFLQRGLSLDVLPALLKIAVKSMSDSDREVFRKAWLEHLIDVAVAAGAKVPIRGDKRKVVAAPAGAEEQSAKNRNQSSSTSTLIRIQMHQWPLHPCHLLRLRPHLPTNHPIPFNLPPALRQSEIRNR